MKKLIAALLSAIMVMAFMPTLAFADATYMAGIDGTYYTTLLKAMDAAEDGDTVTLLADTVAGRGICSFGNIELDLNGYSLTVPAGVEVEVLSGTLTLCNTGGAGKIVNDGMIKVYDEAALDISNLNYSLDAGLIAGHPGSVAIQNGGTLISIPAWHEADPDEIEKDSTGGKFFYGTQTGAKYVVKDKTYYCISTDGKDHSWKECNNKPLAVYREQVFYDLAELAKTVNKAPNGKKTDGSIQFVDNVELYENPFEANLTITTGGSEQTIWLNENFVIDGIEVTFEGKESGPLNVESWLEEEEQSPIIVYPGGVLNIKDNVVLSGGKSNLGGMIYIADEGKVFMSGGEISDCSANMGGAVYDAGLFEMTGGVIKDNKAKFGGGVYIEFNDDVQGKLRLSKDAYIYGNKKTGKKSQNNVYLPINGDKWSNAELEFFGSFTAKAKVGVTSETTPILKGKVVIAENATWDDLDALVSDDAGLELTLDESTIYLRSGNRIKAFIEKTLNPENIKAAIFGGIVTDIIQNVVKSVKAAVAMHYAALKPFLRPVW